jgi:kinesin family protein C1
MLDQVPDFFLLAKHPIVQELKGNIRVFCRVRPLLPGEEECADFSYPDRRDHKEIVVGCSSESAEGHERKEQYHFVFDQVGNTSHSFDQAI